MDFARRQEELALVIGHLNAGYFPLARCELLRFAALIGDRVQMRVAGALRLKVDALVVLHPSEGERARPIDPRVVVLGHDHSSLARRGIEREDPAVFVISGASRDDGFGSVFGPEWWRELDITVARFVRS